jgi:GrpB-like predicted nucleotidyltransferase (UPF0157 family)
VIRLEPYDPAWPRLFEREAARIWAVLGPSALRVEHTGSTSVPGFVAKPIIDILLVVSDSADEAAYVPALEAAGYVVRIREPEWHAHRMLKGPDTDVNLHVFSAGSSEIARVLRFRDRLRASPDDRERYAREKLELARQDWRAVDDYARAKTTVIEDILSRG